MANCPDGLTSGFGVPDSLRSALCSTRSYFGKDHNGFGVYVAGSGCFIGNTGRQSVVMTAAHNLYHPVLKRKARWVNFQFGRVGQNFMASRTLSSGNVPIEFIRGVNALHEWDFALARIPLLRSDRFTPLPIEKSTATGETGKILVGYPNEGACKGLFKPYHTVVSVTPSSPANYSYRNQETYRGMSGGPLIGKTTDGGEYVSYGVHTLGRSNIPHRAVRFSEPVMRRIHGWL
ncbi:trypsin-like peptidase domain-containing protein [Pontixanthobacter sp. CEM42]|uniref:trypsin-like serine peptidase n=1 Tax=Pontixanthobacter sp. CEM42 TaxID=2792077 RepID=UPI001AE09909|nr:trypsin-like peptidase domain-containing protein [Pontixanthobacter sp. CEM42]